MLTKSHYAAQHHVKCQDKQAYRLHMCGLCHALGDEYGVAARLLTNHDMILLNMLTSAQREAEPEVVIRRCPLNPMLKVKTNQDDSSGFAAAVAVELSAVSIADDVQDSNGRDIGARLLNGLLNLPQRNALQTLKSLGFDTGVLTQLGATQSTYENDSEADPAKPSAAASAALFAMTARLSGNVENTETLARIGANYGAYLYLTDAYRDFGQDMAKGEFNPLRRFRVDSSDTVGLSHAGIDWLLRAFRDIHADMQRNIASLSLYRYADTIKRLLTEPIAKVIRELDALREKTAPTYRQWSFMDVLKTAFFMMPAPVADTGLTAVYVTAGQGGIEEPEEDNRLEDKPRKRKRKNNEQEGASDNGCDCLDCSDCTNTRSCDTWDAMNFAYCGSQCISGCGDGPGSNDGCNGCESCSGADCNCSN